MAQTEHEEKYDRLCAEHGVAWDKNSPQLVGRTLDSLRRCYEKDRHLNNVPLRRWDSLAYGFLAYNPRTGLSLAEAVCMQKHAARRLLERNE